MRRTVWTLLFAMLLQLLLSSAWAMRSTQPHGHASHCHEVVAMERSTDAAPPTHAAPNKVKAASIQADSHHCCAIGLGIGIQASLLPLPQATPASPYGSWISQSPRPDLRPPI